MAGTNAAVSGIVTDAANGEPLIGVSIMVLGTSTGTVTGLDGSYEVNVPDGKGTLSFSFVGYKSLKVEISGRSRVDVSLEEDVVGLEEVTVTALGIEKEKKALGYAVQEVGGESLDKARETNLVSALSGKVAGMTIVGNPSGIGSSARVTIRGERSLNINKNQPLFIVDGVPISNEFVGSSGRSNQDVDYGNGAGFVNPDDIEKIVVLKGASAAALYGSRANNGVILITTKSGKNTKGIGVSVNSTVTFETPLRLPEYQNVYGQGLNGEFEFKDGNGSGNKDGVDESWGPAYSDNLLIKQFNSPTSNGLRGGDVGNLLSAIGPVDLYKQLAARGEITPTDWVAQPNNVRDFFETGLTQTHNVAVSGSNAQGDFRISYTYLDQKGIVPNTGLQRNNFSISGGYKLTDKFTARATANYINSYSNNRPNLSYGTENIMYLFNCWLGRSVDVSSLRDYWMAGREGLNQFNFNYNYHDNPYFGLYENTNSQDIDRLYGNITLNYQFTDWLNLMVRTGTDVSNEFRARRRAYSTQRFPLGSYREEKVFFEETNTDFLLSLDRPISSAISFNAAIGGNMMRQKSNYSDIMAPQLAVPGVYSLTNSRVPLTSGAFRSEKRINSLYATTQFGFNNWLYLDLSARNDWSSTLPSDSRSYLYYAANLSAVVSEIMNLSNNSALSFAKVRLGVAQVGNDTDPFQLEAVYNAQTAVQGAPAYSESSVLVNPGLKPEISSAIETGVDVRFFHNRLGLDLTYYNTRSRNQILNIPITNTSGYTSRIINAGLINNYGVEAAILVTPVERPNFSWDINLNFSANRSKVKELYTDPESGEELTNYVLASRYMTVEARVGEQMGNMYGIGFQRVSDDPSSQYYDPTGQYVGQVVYNSQGKPIPTATTILLGNYNPDWLAGIGNTFRYKSLSLGFLFDVRYGGEVYSHTQTVGREGGQIIETLEGRANGYDLSLDGNGVIGEGVVQNGDGTFSPNTTKLAAREWHTSITLGRRLLEAMVYDASFVKLRELSLSYTLPNRLLGKAPIKDISISLVGRNLALWADVPHIDPETSSTSGGTVIPGVESVALPSTRSYGVNLNFKF
ncbi:MAG: SusC/RagA family TonB-linked outer membrane protein [Phaeodactylibacter sp.]|nr:SusC/RagA family TonB-linked outer membrane protein [Phaeodactylibacter sp.]